MDVIAWRAYYGDGSAVDNREANPADLRDGVVGVVQFYSQCVSCSGVRYRDIIINGDYYLWGDDRWSKVDEHPLPGSWVDRDKVRQHHPDKVIVKSAPMLEDDVWNRLQRRIFSDRDMPD